MTGTSPAPFGQSPSYHSSSYLPKMEAAFMKDFTCCGLTLATLHDVLQHFEEIHAGVPNHHPSLANGGLPTTSGAPAAGNTTGQTQAQGEPATHTQFGFQPRSGSVGGARPHRLGSDGFSRTNLSTVQDMDSLEDMEMDEPLPPIGEDTSAFTNQQAQFNQDPTQLQPLNINLANTMQSHQGLRTSAPTTPAATQQFNLPNNPTVSSVNTPTLGGLTMQNNANLTSPDSSHPPTPAELDLEFYNNLNQPLAGMGMDMNFANANYGAGMPGFDGTIDQPGKRLFSKQGGLSQQQLQAAIKNYHLGNDQGELSKRLQQQQMMNGANVPQFPFPEEIKPFKCPVIGCEKAYKNQNGLKYHKQVRCN